MKEEILDYLKRTYSPRAILLYGSYANGTNDAASDFDCMLIVPEKAADHDDSIVAGVQLDCYLFTPEEIEGEDTDRFLTAYDAEIPLDDGSGSALRERVRQYVAEHTFTPPVEKQFLRSWMRKTCGRIRKGDDEANFRAVSLLAESLEDYCLLRDSFYFGSKKTTRMLQSTDPEGYALFHAAITSRTLDDILRWISYVSGEELC